MIIIKPMKRVSKKIKLKGKYAPMGAYTHSGISNIFSKRSSYKAKGKKNTPHFEI